MSALQLWLAVIGGLVLAVLVAHNAWNTRRSRPRQADPTPSFSGSTPGQSADSLHRITESNSASGPLDKPQRVDMSIDLAELDAMGRTDPDALNLPTPERRAQLDVLIDAIAQIELDHSVSGDAVLAAMPTTRRLGSKPFAVEGLNELTLAWEVPQAGQRYSTLQAGLQLANRAGSLNEIEYSEFVVATEAFADHLGGTPDVPEMKAEVARARELDQFASTHDAQLSMTLRARSTAWSPGFVQQCAGRLGFVAGVLPGRMVLPSSTQGRPPILGMSFDAQAALAEDPDQSALREVTLSLEVTHVDRHEQPFELMRDAALTLAQEMGGVLIDDAGQQLSAAAMDQISADLQDLYNTLDARELSAGSVLARRLFS
ncbi:MAG: cell division protein FtsZ [Betaproteobacteria bacterium]|nr:cell division protein FtsZ [Betaproteobacteria bacterium]